jgi:hypothetical protein
MDYAGFNEPKGAVAVTGCRVALGLDGRDARPHTSKLTVS